MKNKFICLLFLAMNFSWASTALSLQVGSLVAAEDIDENNLDFSGNLWYQFDQMVFLGIGSGIQQFGKSKHIPLMGSLFLRLPFGGQALPFISGDWGYLSGKYGQFIWRAGGGCDLKLGDSSSLLFSGGIQEFSKPIKAKHANTSSYYLKAGLLLEF
jgi:hypothetical protein